MKRRLNQIDTLNEVLIVEQFSPWHLRYFRLAKKQSEKSTHYQHKLGCVIVKSNRIVGEGFNKLKSHPKSPHAYSFIHAEFDSAHKVDPKDMKDSIVFVYREHKNGNFAIAKPCKTCAKLLKDLMVKSVYFTIDSGIGCYHFKQGGICN